MTSPTAARAAGLIESGLVLNSDEAAAFLGLSAAKLAVLRGKGKGPAFARTGRLVRYRGDDLTAFEATLPPPKPAKPAQPVVVVAATITRPVPPPATEQPPAPP